MSHTDQSLRGQMRIFVCAFAPLRGEIPLWANADLHFLLPHVVETRKGLRRSNQSKHTQWYIKSNTRGKNVRATRKSFSVDKCWPSFPFAPLGGGIFLWTNADLHVGSRGGLRLFLITTTLTLSSLPARPQTWSSATQCVLREKQWKPVFTTGGVAVGGTAAGWAGAGGVEAGGLAAGGGAAGGIAAGVPQPPAQPQSHAARSSIWSSSPSTPWAPISVHSSKYTAESCRLFFFKRRRIRKGS